MLLGWPRSCQGNPEKDDPGRAWVPQKLAKNDFSENFRENRPLSTQIVLNSP
ncbi:hypothetical protein T11_9181 [Trichinella zimbabwensis]|uniref:Uncharacterized protein n=1 Tax=Trichinella zimbabwensis TaxID=268475 RepID=A0A0V1GJV8_9BILA|nr:hypothetical protein T11_9181 [Trichinella zimbabwensis]